MKKIIFLSDLWGGENPDWISQYRSILENFFDVQYYDCRVLGDISKERLSEAELHSQFLHGGIETAVQQLLEIKRECFAIIGFSIGGYIAWRTLLSGLKSEYLFAISSTRLRYETKKPLAHIELYFGENDLFKPNQEWFRKINITKNIYQNKGHEMYKDREIAIDICKRVIDTVSVK